MTRVARQDVTPIRAVERTPSGGVRVIGALTRAGILLYQNPDGSQRRELRPPDEVFRDDSLASLKDAPLTVGHPIDGVNPENWKSLSVGHISDMPVREGDYAVAHHAIQDSAAIAAVTHVDPTERLTELSCGYTADQDETPGLWQGQHYDSVQRNIVYNHVALLRMGEARAGRNAKLRLDSFGAASGAQQMAIVKIDGIDYESGSAGHIQALEKRADTAQAAATAATASAAAEKARADKATAASSATAIMAAARVRAQVIAGCTKVLTRKDSADLRRRLDDDAPVDGNSDVQLMSAALGAMNGKFSTEGKSDDFIRGAFAYMLGTMADELAETPAGDTPVPDAPMPPPPRADTSGHVRQDNGHDRSRQVPPDALEAAIEKHRSDAVNGYKRPLSTSKDK